MRSIVGDRILKTVLHHVPRLVLAATVAACTPEPQAPLQTAALEAPARAAFEVSLERLDLLDALPARGRAILVNVPAFELIALEDRVPVLRSRVILGATATRTPLIDTYTTTVRFRPTWRPTPSMIASGEYEDYVRPPGRNNPLGLAAVRLEPGLLVYLHDTNRRDLFDREQRAMSHGCVRVERWDELIAWLLDMDIAEVRRRAETGPTVDVVLPPIPVLIRYYRAFPETLGQIAYFDDVYGLQARGPTAPFDVAAAGREPCLVG
jgi:murein L,D-transpeptidase YcbB/YkuD